jgi:hypothetical protein
VPSDDDDEDDDVCVMDEDKTLKILLTSVIKLSTHAQMCIQATDKPLQLCFKVEVKVKLTLAMATKAQRWS